MNKRALLFRIGTVVVLLAICAVMMVVGRGHTVYIDNKALEYNGVTYPAPYKVSAYVDGEQAAKLYEDERGSATNIGQSFEITFKIMENKGGAEVTSTHTIKLPYNIDGIIINVPAYLAGLPEEAYMSEFIPAAPVEDASDEVPSGDEFTMGDF